MNKTQEKLVGKIIEDNFDDGVDELMELLDRRADIVEIAKEFKEINDKVKKAFKNRGLVGEKMKFGNHVIEVKDYNRKGFEVEPVEDGVSVKLIELTGDMLE